MRFNRIIDIGCGSAPYIEAIEARCSSYIGIDLKSQTERSRAQALRHAKRHFLVSDACVALEELSPAAGDAILAVFSAHHIGLSRLIPVLATAVRAGTYIELHEPRLFPVSSGSEQLAETLFNVSADDKAQSTNLYTDYLLEPEYVSHLQREFCGTPSGRQHILEDFDKGILSSSCRIRSLLSGFDALTAVENIAALTAITARAREPAGLTKSTSKREFA